MNIHKAAATATVVILLHLCGCSSLEHDASDPSPTERNELLAAVQAKQAVVELVRANPKMFIGSPDPDMLAALPLDDRGSGEFAFGAFVVYPNQRLYKADIGFGAPEVYSYLGSFERKDDKWIASEPEVSRFHEPLNDNPRE